jgi:hypothetical protein
MCSGGTRCSGKVFQECKNGNWSDVEQCGGADVCADNLGCVACNPAFGNVCQGNDVVMCNADGTIGPVVTTCALEACSNGQCGGACAAAEQNRSYLGCEYWPVDLDNAIEVFGPELFPGSGCGLSSPDAKVVTSPVCVQGNMHVGECDWNNDCTAAPGAMCKNVATCALDAFHSPYAIVVSNPQTDAVMVTLTNAAGLSKTVTVAPGAVASIFPQSLGFPDQTVNHSGIETKAYKLTSTKPIVAYQFNPLNNVAVFSNDASLLLPRHTYDTKYLGVTYKTLKRRPQRNDYNGYLTVVASGPGQTMVTVKATAAVRPGQNVPAMGQGATQTFMLSQFQTLNLEAGADADLSGSAITCSQPCGVFVGHEATGLYQGTSATCCADHLEDQLFPTSTWGKVYVVTKSKDRTKKVADMIRVMAQKDNTTITFNPPQTGCAGALGPGEYCDVFITGDVEVSSAEPILVGHYLLSNGGADMDAGDPAIAFAVPTEQYRKEYTLLVPMQYNANFMSLVAPKAGTVTLDGTDVTGMLASFGSGEYKAGRVSVNAGQHKLECSEGCGVEIYGWSDAVSYLFAGGLDLKQIVVN